MLALLVAVPALLVSGLAFARTELAVRVVEAARETLGISVSSAPAERPAKPARRKAEPLTSAPAPVAVRESALAAAPAPAPLPTTVVGSARRHRTRAPKTIPASLAPAPAPQTITPPPASAPAPFTAVTAQSLFDRANSARRAGRMLEASALYRELNTRFSTSSEARVAIVLLARLQLDGGESESALAGFEAYLESGHAALREQAMVGRAQALRKLGREAEERAAVRELLRTYPDAPYARLARERLELEGP
jgi:TolA-binding protein